MKIAPLLVIVAAGLAGAVVGTVFPIFPEDDKESSMPDSAVETLPTETVIQIGTDRFIYGENKVCGHFREGHPMFCVGVSRPELPARTQRHKAQ